MRYSGCTLHIQNSQPDKREDMPNVTRPNVKVVTSLYDALRRKDIHSMAALSNPDITVHQSEEVPWGGVYQGIEQALQFFGKVSSFLDSSVSIERILDAGDCVAVIGRTVGTVKATQQPFDTPLVHLWQLREGRIASLAVFLDHAMLPQLQSEPATTYG